MNFKIHKCGIIVHCTAQKMASDASGPRNAAKCFPVASHSRKRGVLNTQVFALPFEASLNETMASYSSDLMDSRVNVTQRAVLKTLSKNFQREIKSIFEEGTYVSEMCDNARHLTENANKMIFGVYRASLPHYFYTKIRAIEDVRWKVFFTQRILVFHNHLSQHGSKTMGLDGTVAIDSEVSFQKSDFDLIPVETRTRASKLSRRITEPADMPGEDRPRKTARKNEKAASKK